MLRSKSAANGCDDGAATASDDHIADPAAPIATPLLDLIKIAEMESLIGAQAVSNMLNMISAEIVSNIPAMIDDHAAGNIAQACKAAHRLRGAASLLGVQLLADGLSQFEKLAGESKDIHYIINHLRQIATDTLRAIAGRHA